MPSLVKDPALIGVSSGAVDAHGKAIFGSPGPGAYEAPTLFARGGADNPATALEARAGHQIYSLDGKFSILGRTSTLEDESLSPGPAAHVPLHAYVDPNPHNAHFGSASRDAEAKRFISQCLPSGDATSPGPGAYRFKTGKGHPGTTGDGPTTKIGTSGRAAVSGAAGQDTPGAKYHLPSTVGDAPGYSLGPLNSNKAGKARDRSHEAAQCHRLYMGPILSGNAEMSKTPAPSAYNDQSHMRHTKQPRPTMGSSTRDQAARLRAGGAEFETMQFGKESPNKFYPPVSTLSRAGGARAMAERFNDPQRGAAASGPFISKQHISHVQGCDSPGAIYDHERFLAASKAEASGCVFPKGKRPDLVPVDDNPSAATYLIKRDADFYRYNVPGSFSIASNLRTDWSALTGNGAPGPGEYDVTSKKHLELSRPRAATFKLGEVTGKHGRSTSLIPTGADDTPGPDAYMELQQLHPHKPKAASYSFGRRDGISEETMAKSKLGSVKGGQTGTRRFYSKLQAQACAGDDSPGVGQFDLSGRVTSGKDAAIVKRFVGKMARTTRARDKRRFISRQHAGDALGHDSPGPAEYQPRTQFLSDPTSRFKRSGGCSFGTAARPTLAKVVF